MKETEPVFKPIEVKALADYRLWLRYTDGTEGEVDLSHIAGRSVFAAWDDYRAFEKVHIRADGAIAWNDEIELCPDALYLRLTGKTPEEVFPKLKAADVNA